MLRYLITHHWTERCKTVVPVLEECTLPSWKLRKAGIPSKYKILLQTCTKYKVESSSMGQGVSLMSSPAVQGQVCTITLTAALLPSQDFYY
jgi:hypothetical protein